MPMQNPVKGRVQGWLGGLLAGPLAWGVGGAGPVGMVLGIFAMTGAVLLYCVHEYQLIVIANQEMHAASFDAQSVLAANHLTPEQAASNLARGMVVNGLDGKPIVGKSLEALTAYLERQAKARIGISEAAMKEADVKVRTPALVDHNYRIIYEACNGTSGTQAPLAYCTINTRVRGLAGSPALQEAMSRGYIPVLENNAPMSPAETAAFTNYLIELQKRSDAESDPTKAFTSLGNSQGKSC